ncbi:hypothetical protein [Sphingobium yanoikuyae]|uniref:Uncharacterized protein n=1 Tax=Sphingobium yanoikuyae TaxID=13690 RepID=A0A9X7YBC9_SPHYA|nr:hypothetical protein [Sphingobium yanoikuyae]QNG44259.1 hypothetical protein H3V42_20575 [Sphingobium yanoikuyae]
MARGNSKGGSGGTSRFRFVLFEGDLQEGELAQVTQAIQNAFRGSQASSPRTIGRSSVASPPCDTDATDFDQVEEAEEVGADNIPRARPVRKARAPKVPNPVNDLDVKSEPSLKDFVADYDVKSGFEKYLVIALWLRDGRDINSFTVDHIYTCFKLIGWSTNSNDFSKPLRNLADNKFLSGDCKGYSLSLTGAGKIEDKKRNSE